MYKANEKTIHGSGIPPEPDAKVQKTEDAFMKQSSGIQALGNLSLAKDFFPARPAHGTKGNHVTVWANFFEVGFDPNMLYFRYSVDVKPEGKAPKASKSKIQRLLILLLELEDFRGALTDFRSNLYSRTQLKNVPGDTLISFRAQGEDVPPTIPARYRILIQETGTVLVSQYQNSLSSTNFNDPQFVQRNEVLQALNTNLGHYAQLRHDLVTLGQNKHYPIDPPDNADLGKWLQALRGFYISFRPATSRILLNVNVSHTVCFAPLRLDYLLRELGGKDHLGRLARKLKLLRLQRLHLLGRKNKAGKVIPSVAVFLDFATPNDGTTEANPPQVRAYGAGPKDVKFFLTGEQPVSKGLSGKKTGKAAGPGSGKYISVWDYFSTKYPAIRMVEQFPVINVGNRQFPRYLPVEACQVLPGQISGAKLSGDQTRWMIGFACRKPSENADSIVGAGRKVLSLDPPRNAALKKNGLNVLPGLITVQARVLPPPQVRYSGGKMINTANGSWNLDKIQFHKGSKIGKWMYVWIRTRRDKPESSYDFNDATALLKTVEKFINVLRISGVSLTRENLLARRPIVDIASDPLAAANNNRLVLNCLESLWGSDNNTEMPRFILVILPYNDAAIYGTIKTFCDIKAGVHTVCVVGSKFAGEQPGYFANVAMKINLKAGGVNHVLDGPKLGVINDGNTMVVGIDVTHPSPQSEDTAPSVAGVVASIDKTLGQWPCALRHQKGRTEMVADLEEMFKSRLLLWRTHNKTLPKNILVYRDGVSEGQYQKVLDEELPLLRAACIRLYPPKEQPAISLIIVGKRHHVRFYPTKLNDADSKSGNCKNGTVVDRGVTDVRYWHFYLQAHACIKGTARSAHYYVLVDEIFRAKAKRSTDPSQRNAADALEQLTHNLCYLFGRATKAVSICPPAYYADLLCERSRLYLSRLFDPSTPTAPPTPSVASQPAVSPTGPDAARAADYAIHPRLRDSMFYI